MNDNNNNASAPDFEPFDPVSAGTSCSEFALSARPDSPLVSKRKSSELSTEPFRDLQTRLGEICSRQPFKTLLVTSAVRGEGKTFVAANLAYGLATEGRERVLLIDADVRNPSVHSAYGMTNKCGLKELLVGGRDVSGVVTKISQSELYVMPGGTASCETLSLPAVSRISALLNHLGPAFDLILLDSAPLLVASDTRLVSKVVDAALLVVRCGSTPRELVVKGQEALNGKPILGTVFNRVDLNHLSYSSYYRYGPNSRNGHPKK